MRGTRAENHDRGPAVIQECSPQKINEFAHFYDENCSFGTKKAFLDKSGPFDRQSELMSLQDSLMPPLKPQARKTGGLPKTGREALSSSEDFAIR